MVRRPRTKLKKARRSYRCPKCGKLTGLKKRRCKTCHKQLR